MAMNHGPTDADRFSWRCRSWDRTSGGVSKPAWSGCGATGSPWMTPGSTSSTIPTTRSPTGRRFVIADVPAAAWSPGTSRPRTDRHAMTAGIKVVDGKRARTDGVPPVTARAPDDFVIGRCRSDINSAQFLGAQDLPACVIPPLIHPHRAAASGSVLQIVGPVCWRAPSGRGEGTAGTARSAGASRTDRTAGTVGAAGTGSDGTSGDVRTTGTGRRRKQATGSAFRAAPPAPLNGGSGGTTGTRRYDGRGGRHRRDRRHGARRHDRRGGDPVPAGAAERRGTAGTTGTAGPPSVPQGRRAGTTGTATAQNCRRRAPRRRASLGGTTWRQRDRRSDHVAGSPRPSRQHRGVIYETVSRGRARRHRLEQDHRRHLRRRAARPHQHRLERHRPQHQDRGLRRRQLRARSQL
jgi:hypothetical protein